MGYRVEALGFRVSSGLGVQGLGCRFEALGFGVWGVGFRL